MLKVGVFLRSANSYFGAESNPTESPYFRKEASKYLQRLAAGKARTNRAACHKCKPVQLCDIIRFRTKLVTSALKTQHSSDNAISWPLLNSEKRPDNHRCTKHNYVGARLRDAHSETSHCHATRSKPPKSLKLTGPKTQSGKVHSSRNSWKHGILSAQVPVIDGRGEEDTNSFDALFAGLREEFQPYGTLEDLLVQQIAISLLATGPGPQV